MLKLTKREKRGKIEVKRTKKLRLTFWSKNNPAKGVGLMIQSGKNKNTSSELKDANTISKNLSSNKNQEGFFSKGLVGDNWSKHLLNKSIEKIINVNDYLNVVYGNVQTVITNTYNELSKNLLQKSPSAEISQNVSIIFKDLEQTFNKLQREFSSLTRMAKRIDSINFKQSSKGYMNSLAKIEKDLNNFLKLFLPKLKVELDNLSKSKLQLEDKLANSKSNFFSDLIESTKQFVSALLAKDYQMNNKVIQLGNKIEQVTQEQNLLQTIQKETEQLVNAFIEAIEKLTLTKEDKATVESPQDDNNVLNLNSNVVSISEHLKKNENKKSYA